MSFFGPSRFRLWEGGSFSFAGNKDLAKAVQRSSEPDDFVKILHEAPLNHTPDPPHSSVVIAPSLGDQLPNDSARSGTIEETISGNRGNDLHLETAVVDLSSQLQISNSSAGDCLENPVVLQGLSSGVQQSPVAAMPEIASVSPEKTTQRHSCTEGFRDVAKENPDGSKNSNGILLVMAQQNINSAEMQEAITSARGVCTKTNMNNRSAENMTLSKTVLLSADSQTMRSDPVAASSDFPVSTVRVENTAQLVQKSPLNPNATEFCLPAKAFPSDSISTVLEETSPRIIVSLVPSAPSPVVVSLGKEGLDDTAATSLSAPPILESREVSVQEATNPQQTTPFKLSQVGMQSNNLMLDYQSASDDDDDAEEPEDEYENFFDQQLIRDESYLDHKYAKRKSRERERLEVQFRHGRGRGCPRGSRRTYFDIIRTINTRSKSTE